MVNETLDKSDFRKVNVDWGSKAQSLSFKRLINELYMGFNLKKHHTA